MPDNTFPRNTTPCPQCGAPTLTVRRRHGAGGVTLDVRSDLHCYLIIIPGAKDPWPATAAESLAYPEHEPLCRGQAPQEVHT